MSFHANFLLANDLHEIPSLILKKKIDQLFFTINLKLVFCRSTWAMMTNNGDPDVHRIYRSAVNKQINRTKCIHLKMNTGRNKITL